MNGDQGKRYFLKRFFIFLVISTFLVLFAKVAIPFLDSFRGIGYDAYLKPKIQDENSFYVDVDVPCNKIFDREVGLIIDPPIAVEKIIDAPSAITGDVKVTVIQGDKRFEEYVDMSNSGSKIDSIGVWSKTLVRFPPLNGVFCDPQKISVEASNLSFSVKKHEVFVYVSKDRRL